MKLYFGTKTAWAGELIWEIVKMCGEHYHVDHAWTNTQNNFKTPLVMAAEGILTKNHQRNYRFTIETYFNSLCVRTPSPDDQFWNWGQFVLKGRIPFGTAGYYTVNLTAETVEKQRCLVLEVGCYGLRGEYTASKIATWRQDILVAWLARYNWEILRLPVAVESRVMCLGEFLATELFANCGDAAGRLATFDEIEDRGQRWLIS